MTRATFNKILILILFTVLIYLGIQNIYSIWVFLGYIMQLLMPIIIGFALAFVLNVPMKGIEKNLFDHPFYLSPQKQKNFHPGKWNRKLKRPISLLLALSILFSGIAVIVFYVIPTLVITVSELVNTIPKFLASVQDKINIWFDNNEKLNSLLSNMQLNWESIVSKILSALRTGGSFFLMSTFTATTSLMGMIGNFLVSLIMAIYMLMSKEELQRQSYKFMRAFFTKEEMRKKLPVLRLINQTFSSYVSGQVLEAFILGAMIYTMMAIFAIPLAPVVTALVIIMALIPIVGAFISGAIGTLLVLTQNPTKALIFIILFLVIQQIEGNLIYPHVVGKSVKLPGLWVLVAISIGGSLAGMVGILISIPVFSVIYSLVKEWVNNRIRAEHGMNGRSNLLKRTERFVSDDLEVGLQKIACQSEEESKTEILDSFSQYEAAHASLHVTRPNNPSFAEEIKEE